MHRAVPRRGVYELVRPYPDGRSTPSRFARAAARYGYDGIVVRVPAAAEGRRGAVAADETAGVDVVPAAEIDATDPDRAGGRLRDCREQYPVVIARGGTDRANRFAAGRERVDALVAPADALPDHGTVGVAAANGVRIGIDLAPILRATGGARVRAIDALRDLRRLIDHHGAAHVVTATPDSHLELRTPRALAAVGDAVGAAGGRAAESAAAHAATLDGDWLRDGLREWGRIAARNRDRLSDAHVEPGVRRGSAAGTDPTAGDPEGADR